MNPQSASIKHFLDIIYDVSHEHINVENLKAVIRDKAWHELPPVLQLKERPHFQYISQYFVLTQTDGNLCLVKHYYVKDDKVKGPYIARLLQGRGFEIGWAKVNQQQARRGLQYMLEQLGGHQFRHFSLSAEKRKASSAVAALPEDEQDAGWDFIIANGERDRSNLKQLRGIHRHIKRDGSPINGWNEKLVQRAFWTAWPMMVPWLLSSADMI